MKLAAGRTEAGPAPAAAPAMAKQDRGADRLGPLAGGYARAWSDAERMRQAGLPVLPHQAAALARAERALDGQLPGFGQDLQAALSQAPRLAEGAGTDAGRAARGARERLEARAHEAVRAWGKLEHAYEQAGKKYDHLAQREIGGRLERFAKG